MELSLSQKLHKEREQLRSFCMRHNRIRVFGSGDTAILMQRHLQEEGVCIHDFIVADADYTVDTFCGRPVCRYSDAHFERTDGLILAVAHWMQELLIPEFAKRKDIPGIYQQSIYGKNEGLIFDASMIYSHYIGEGNPEGYFARFTELDRIGAEKNTDKAHKIHNYLNKYEFYLRHLKEQTFTLLELGIFNGSSLRMWEEFFPNARIIGVDIDERCASMGGDRTKVIIDDLSLIDTLESLKSYTPSVIIDDASHVWSHQIKSLCTLFPVLPHGGIFIMEDLETSFSAYRHKNYNDASISCYAFLSEIASSVTGGEKPLLSDRPQSIAQFAPEIEAIARETELISFLKGSCILIKR
ncbi:MAG: hypothetical protein IK016_02190 [Lachnospiraceae bacterium]|nr:hypothetical protein [Lachnospiraceae bacterium]